MTLISCLLNFKHFFFIQKKVLHVHGNYAYLFSLSSSEQVTLSNPLDVDRLDMSMRHLPLNQFVTCFELRKDAVESRTFYDMIYRAESGEFNASKIIKKYEGLFKQSRLGILTA